MSSCVATFTPNSGGGCSMLLPGGSWLGDGRFATAPRAGRCWRGEARTGSWVGSQDLTTLQVLSSAGLHCGNAPECRRAGPSSSRVRGPGSGDTGLRWIHRDSRARQADEDVRSGRQRWVGPSALLAGHSSGEACAVALSSPQSGRRCVVAAPTAGVVKSRLTPVGWTTNWRSWL